MDGHTYFGEITNAKDIKNGGKSDMRALRFLYRILRTFVLKIQYNKRCQISGLLKIDHNAELIILGESTMNIGKGVSISSGTHLESGSGGNIVIGDRCFFNRNCIIVSRKSIQIGNSCLFGPNVTIYDHDHKYTANGVQEEYNLSDVIIGEGSWIGANVTILRGTKIGKGCIIGAGCIVKGTIPDFSLVTSDRSLIIRSIER